jgi:6-phosphogluconolactonase (cycloisomerase 2 family)
MDPSGKYLLMSNAFADSVSVYSVSSGTLTLVGEFPAGKNPNDLKFSPSGNFVYVSNSSVGFITGFAFNASSGTLTPVTGSPFPSGGGVSGLAIDGSNHLLFAANSSDNTVSVFTIDGSGALQQISGSPFPAGTAPLALTVDTTNTFLYVANSGSGNVSAFSVNATTGALTAITGSPFSAGTEPLYVLAEPAGGFIYVGNQTSTNVSSFSYDTSTGALTAVSGSPFSVGSAPGQMVVVH